MIGGMIIYIACARRAQAKGPVPRTHHPGASYMRQSCNCKGEAGGRTQSAGTLCAALHKAQKSKHKMRECSRFCMQIDDCVLYDPLLLSLPRLPHMSVKPSRGGYATAPTVAAAVWRPSRPARCKPLERQLYLVLTHQNPYSCVTYESFSTPFSFRGLSELNILTLVERDKLGQNARAPSSSSSLFVYR